MKKRTILLLIIFVVIISGAAGFCGAYLATNLINPAPANFGDDAVVVYQEPNEAMTDEQLNAYLGA